VRLDRFGRHPGRPAAPDLHLLPSGPATPVGTQRTAEHFRLEDGRIASITPIFDATWWRPMMAMLDQDPPPTSGVDTATP
jgi:hypothetical protein